MVYGAQLFHNKGGQARNPQDTFRKQSTNKLESLSASVSKPLSMTFWINSKSSYFIAKAQGKRTCFQYRLIYGYWCWLIDERLYTGCLKIGAMKGVALHNICMRCSSRSTMHYSNRPRHWGLTSLRMKFSKFLDATSELQLVWEQSRLKWDTCVSSPVLLSNSTLLTWFWAENDQKDFQGNIDALLRSLILEHEKKLGRKAHERAKAEAMRMNLRREGWSISSEVDLVMFESILHGQGNVIRVDNCHHTTPFHSCRYIINLIFDFVLHSSSVFIISTHSHLFKTTSPKTALSQKNLVSSR